MICYGEVGIVHSLMPLNFFLFSLFGVRFAPRFPEDGSFVTGLKSEQPLTSLVFVLRSFGNANIYLKLLS